MMKIKKILEESWNYTLCEMNGMYLLAVTSSSGSFDYTAFYKLLPSELPDINHDALNSLADHIRAHRQEYKAKEYNIDWNNVEWA